MSAPTCVYCTKARPFTEEHVFPAGMGGDDHRYILRNLVCGVCNTEIFSPLEIQLMRNSPFALSRLQEQPTGRGRGGRARAPIFAHDRCEIIDEEGRVLEAQLQAGWKPISLPQLQILNGEARVSVPETMPMTGFIGEISTLLTASIQIVEKIWCADGTKYRGTNVVWDGFNYLNATQTVHNNAPKNCIWISTLAENNERPAGWPRLFKRTGGQMVLRVTNLSDALDFLSVAKRNLPSLLNNQTAAIKSIEKPLVRVGMRAEPQKILRALAKIGTNFACHEYGEVIFRSSAFDPIKSAIIYGVEPVKATNLPNIHEMFSRDTRKVHVAMLFPLQIGSGGLGFLIRLYGGQVQMIVLAEEFDPLPNLSPVVFVINYLDNRIDRLDLYEYVNYLLREGLEPTQ